MNEGGSSRSRATSLRPAWSPRAARSDRWAALRRPVRRCRRGSSSSSRSAADDVAVVTIGDDGSVNDGPDHDPDVTPEPRSAEPEQTQPIGGQRPAEQRWAPPGAPGAAGVAAPAAPLSPPPAGPPASPPSAYPPPPPTQVLAPAAPTAHRAERAERARPSGWVWPLVAVLALVLGTVGGVLGGIGYSEWNDDSADDNRASAPNGVDNSDLTTQPPLDKPGSVARVAQEVLPSTVQIIAEFEGVEAGATGSGFVLDARATSSPTTTSSRTPPRTTARSRSSTRTATARTRPSSAAAPSTTSPSSTSPAPRTSNRRRSASPGPCASASPSSRSAPRSG